MVPELSSVVWAHGCNPWVSGSIPPGTSKQRLAHARRLCYNDSMNAFMKMLVAYQNGIKNPYRAFRVSKETGLPYAVLCAILEKESAGGANVFGHDGGATGWASGWGRVTKRKYLRYKRGRQAGKGMQGVGPMQLTWWEFQDRADERGGCWKPYVNMVVGSEILHNYWNRYGNWKQVGERWNGAAEYGEDLAAKIREWRERFNA